MRSFVIALLASSILLLCCGSTPALEDSYAGAVEAAIQASSLPNPSHLRTEFRTGIEFWPRKPSYAAVRAQVGALGQTERQIRLETGNANTNSYEVIWFAETAAGVTVFSNVFPRGELSSAAVRPEAWLPLLDRVTGEPNLSRCRSSLAVSDGSVYLGSILTNGGARQFAVYGWIPPSPRDDTLEALYQDLLPCSEIIAAITQAARETFAERRSFAQ